MAVNFRQGEDLILEIPVIDNQNTKVVLTGLDKIRVAFIIKLQTVQKYLDTDLETILTGYGEVFVNAIDNTVLDVYVTREQSKGFPIGELSASVIIQYPDTALTGIAEEYEFVLGNVLKGYLKDEDLTI